MKRLVFAIFTVVILALPVGAQSPPTAVVDIPFGFVAGNTTAPAGEYVLSVSSASFLVALLGPDLHTHMLMSRPDDTLSKSEQPVLIFHRYGDQYFLSEIRTSSRSREFPASRMEREAMKTASAGRASQEIVLAMR
jgi:hypothetical protein